MTKMEMLERFYERHEELERKLDAAENDGNTRVIEACQKSHQELLEEVRAEGEAFGDMMRLYSEMKQQGNSRLDLSGTYRKPEEIIRIFRDSLFLQTNKNILFLQNSFLISSAKIP